MVDTQYLESLILASGKKKGYLAEKIGCSRQYFNKKSKNEVPFTVSEANILCSELNVTKAAEKTKIFLI